MKTKAQVTDYNKQAIDFIEKHGITFEAKFLEYGIHFEGEKERRDIYKIVFRKKNALLDLDFGQSIAHSSKIRLKDLTNSKKSDDKISWDTLVDNPNKETPTPYDVIACITKHDPGSFEDFCSDFGYDEDSRKAYSIWESVTDEWVKVRMFFTDQELAEIQEIQ